MWKNLHKASGPDTDGIQCAYTDQTNEWYSSKQWDQTLSGIEFPTNSNFTFVELIVVPYDFSVWCEGIVQLMDFKLQNRALYGNMGVFNTQLLFLNAIEKWHFQYIRLKYGLGN